MSDFNDFWEELKNEVIALAENQLQDFKDQAIAAGKDFIEQSKDDLKFWSEQLASGQMNKNDFEWLVKGKKDLAELILLKHKGLAKVQVDKFINGLLEVVIGTALKNFVK